MDKLKATGKALYSCMLNPQGGVIDDLIVYYFSEDWFRLVVNAATREKDLAWIGARAAAFDVEVSERPDFAMIAVQGPAARERVHGLRFAGRIDDSTASRVNRRFDAETLHINGPLDVE